MFARYNDYVSDCTPILPRNMVTYHKNTRFARVYFRFIIERRRGDCIYHAIVLLEIRAQFYFVCSHLTLFQGCPSKLLRLESCYVLLRNGLLEVGGDCKDIPCRCTSIVDRRSASSEARETIVTRRYSVEDGWSWPAPYNSAKAWLCRRTG
jgi:hypothetical protein